MRTWIALTVLVVAAALAMAPAFAQGQMCAPADQIVTILKDKYGEEVVSTGAGPSGVGMMMFAHPDGDTWSMVVLLPDGRACLIASGTEFQNIARTPPGSET